MMKRGFTLIELLIVVGIMAFLGVAASSSYSALQRGMSERGAISTASSLLRAANGRAMVDRTQTVVFFYNRMLKEATDDSDYPVVVGEAVAVRRAGRITAVRGNNWLVDEFMDVSGSYDILKQNDIEDCKGMKLWRLYDNETSMNSMEYSVVADAVAPLDKTTLNLQTYEGWSTGESSANSNLPFVVYAFYNLGTSDFEPAGNWTPGQAYGFEFAKVRLPKNFIFGQTMPQKFGQVVQPHTPITFSPSRSYEANANQNVDIYYCTPDSGGSFKARKVGTANGKED